MHSFLTDAYHNRKVLYDSLLTKVKSVPRFKLLDETNQFLYLKPEEIGHPHAVLVFKDKDRYDIFQFTSAYSPEGVRTGDKILGGLDTTSVKEAVNVWTGELVAIKCCSKLSDFYVKDFNEHLTLAGHLESEHIIKLHCFGLGTVYSSDEKSKDPYHDKIYFTVMDKGYDTLDKVLNFELTKQEKIRLFQEIVLFYKHVFQQGLQYYDFESRNLCIDRNLRLKVCDLDTIEKTRHPIIPVDRLNDMFLWFYISRLSDENRDAFSLIRAEFSRVTKEVVKDLNSENLNAKVSLLVLECAKAIEKCENLPNLKPLKPYPLSALSPKAAIKQLEIKAKPSS